MKRDFSIFDHMLEGCQVISPEWRYVYVNDEVARQGRKSPEELLGQRMADVYPGIESSPVFAYLERCMRRRKAEQVETEFRFPDGLKRWFELRIQPLEEGILVLSLDITARKEADEERSRQLERLRSLRAIDMAILGTTDLRLGLKVVVEQAQMRLAVDAAAVFLFRSASARMEAVESYGLQNTLARRAAVRLDHGILGKAASERKIVHGSAGREGSTGGIPPSWVQEGLKHLSAAPLIAQGELIGVLAVANREERFRPPEWVDFLEAVSDQAAIAVFCGRSFERIQTSNFRLIQAYEATVEGWARALELRDEETVGHTLRVTDLTLALARSAQLDDEMLVHVRHGALLHDIGKMGIPDSILLKPGPLTGEEQAIMRRHPTHAYELLSRIPYLRPALDIPYCHHERWDGTGYPRGLSEGQIPLAARLFAVVDVWDALSSDRPYRRAWSQDRVLDYLAEESGRHFDPTAVDLFLELDPSERLAS